MPDLQKALRVEQPWPWVAGRLARGEAVVAEPRWDGLRGTLSKTADGWFLQFGADAPIAWPFDALPAHDPVVLDGVLTARQGALWLSKTGVHAVLAGEQQAHIAFRVVDCLHTGEEDLTNRPQAVRRLFAEQVATTLGPPLIVSPAMDVTGKATYAGAEGWAASHHPSRGVLLKSRNAPTSEAGAWIALGPVPAEPERARPGMKLVKAEPAQQKVVGIVFEPDIEDTQGDITSAADIERAAHQFLADYRAGKTELWLNHDTRLSDADVVLVENYVAPENMTVGGQFVRKGSWLQVWHVKNASLWQMVVDGALTGFSFGGTGLRGPLLKQDRLALRIERDQDGRAIRYVTPQGRYKACYDEHRRFAGLEKVA